MCDKQSLCIYNEVNLQLDFLMGFITLLLLQVKFQTISLYHSSRLKWKFSLGWNIDLVLTKYLNLFEAEGWGVEADSVKILLVSLQKLSLVQLEIVLANFSLKSLPFNMFSSMKIYTKFELYPGFTLTSFRTHCPWSRGFASFFHNSIFIPC